MVDCGWMQLSILLITYLSVFLLNRFFLSEPLKKEIGFLDVYGLVSLWVVLKDIHCLDLYETYSSAIGKNMMNCWITF